MDNEYSIEVEQLSFPLSSILQEIGYGQVTPKDEIRLLIETLFNEVRQVVHPSCLFQILNGEIEGEKVILENGATFHVGKILSRLLQGADQFALFTATVGNEFQKYRKEVAQENLLHDFIIDTIGSCLVEAVGDKMETFLEQETAPKRHTHRFSPGYCGWPLTDQKTLFRLLNGKPCGIILSEECLMLPEKSISGIIGIGTQVNEKAYGCRYCEMDTCYKRKRRKK